MEGDSIVINGHCSEDNQLHRLSTTVRLRPGDLLRFSHLYQSTVGSHEIGNRLSTQTQCKPDEQAAVDDWWLERVWEWHSSAFTDMTNHKSRGFRSSTWELVKSPWFQQLART